MLPLQTPLQNISRIAPKYLKLLNKIGLQTVEDLLRHFPFRFNDYSQIVPVSALYLDQIVTVQGRVIKTKINRIFRRRITIVEVVIQDENNTPLKAVWFNQPYILESLKEKTEIRLSGKLTLNKKFLAMTNPAWERVERDPTNTGRLVPIYPETAGLTSRWLRWQISMILKNNFDFQDPISENILRKLKLPDLKKAVKYIHFPENRNQYLLAQKRFAFEEMFLLQLKSLQVRASWEKEKAVAIKFDEKLIKDFVSSLPFRLTNAQRKASFQILKDLEKSRPMNRLLNGDVGSGKTAVAAIAALQAVNTGFQAVIMAPTEVLAKQHFDNFTRLFKNYNFNVALLTNSYKEVRPLSTPTTQRGQVSIARLKMLEKIKSGEINLVIGTHALIQKSVKFKNLALIIVDEQHRFGVAQRAYLQQQITSINDGLPDKIPHLLTMTATPIPRTLALAFFGNLDLSVLDEMPKNRKKIITQIIPPNQREKIYAFIRSEIKKGRQCFVILPLVEESKVLAEIKAAAQEYERLVKEIFPDLNIGLIHGKLKSDEKEKAMQDFTERKTDILVATAVVEVGIDIPNASVMIIEDADRFGLSQLHQFRGRIGRGEAQSYCFLFSSSNGENATQRIKALAESEDGFKIAEKDLALRGPGEFLGTRQSGIPDIAMENLTNVKLIAIAREEAETLLQSDLPLKEHPLLANALQKFNRNVHLE